MTDDNKAPPPSSPKPKPKENKQLLEQMWRLQAAALVAALEEGQPSAALLNVVRQFLSDNRISLATLIELRGAAGFDPGTLPRFDDGPEGSGDDADNDLPDLRKPSPFA
jgi:hypothetical protein